MEDQGKLLGDGEWGNNFKKELLCDKPRLTTLESTLLNELQNLVTFINNNAMFEVPAFTEWESIQKELGDNYGI